MGGEYKSVKSEKVVNVEKLWRGEYPLFTDGKHVITERCNVEPISPVRTRGLRMYEVRPYEEQPTRALWRLPAWHEEERVCLPARDRIREMHQGQTGDSMALSRNMHIGRAYQARQSGRIPRQSSGKLKTGLVRPVRLQRKEDSHFYRFDADRAELGQAEREESARAMTASLSVQFEAKASDVCCSVRDQVDKQRAKMEEARREGTTRDLLEVSRWLCTSGRALKHQREVGTARLELVA